MLDDELELHESFELRFASELNAIVKWASIIIIPNCFLSCFSISTLFVAAAILKVWTASICIAGLAPLFTATASLCLYHSPKFLRSVTDVYLFISSGKRFTIKVCVILANLLKRL